MSQMTLGPFELLQWLNCFWVLYGWMHACILKCSKTSSSQSLQRSVGILRLHTIFIICEVNVILAWYQLSYMQVLNSRWVCYQKCHHSQHPDSYHWVQILYSVLLGFKLTSLIIPKGGGDMQWGGASLVRKAWLQQDRKNKNNGKTNLFLCYSKCEVQCMWLN